ncbi:YnjH family protein [Mangrovibacter phragmitis]|uniref:YnjH family protein n=1 Tax=Mangrovibacter phragmitis TaxID=1691903 RepID=UPI000942FF17|nr:YnjH family protein [Mangrovibacter phragmitis]
MVKHLFAVSLVLGVSLGAAAQNRQPDVQVNVPSEVFTTQGQQQIPPCNQCCIYQNQNYSEGAVIKMEGVLLQCQRDDQVMGTNPLIWRRVKP